MIKAAKRFKTQEKSSWQGKKSEEKEKKQGSEEGIVDAAFESNVNTEILIRNYTC